jgi:hypothetical protein
MASRQKYICRKRGCPGCGFCKIDTDAILTKINEKYSAQAQDADGTQQCADEAIADEGQHQADGSGREACEADAPGESEADAD